MDAAEVIRQHERSGRRFIAGGVGSFVLDQGSGEAVVCLHGVPASAFLYRKVIKELAARGLRGIAFDLPGLGLADRPDSFDYTWTGLGRFAVAAVDVLGLDRFHLVVHDIGGPVGFEMAAAAPERVASLTVLNAPVEVDIFRRPWVMEPFAHRRIGEIYLRILNKPLFRWLMLARRRRPDQDHQRRAGRLSGSTPSGGSRPSVPQDHARVRADPGEAAAIHRGTAQRPVSGPDCVGRGRSCAQDQRGR
jgi:pimeloyl-ACP methyl ester carboxylesterase